MDNNSLLASLHELEDCHICPRNCHVNRLTGKAGYCQSDASFNIASICIHHGEEPPISGKTGICNIFFTNCNLQCIYCQNHQISDNRIPRNLSQMGLEEVADRVISILDQGINRVGFVSPSHFVPQVRALIEKVKSRGYHPVWVYNTNGYDKAETIRSLEGTIDVYLPDFKYADSQLSHDLSGARDYPDIAAKAIGEMFRQKGSTLILDNDGQAESGLIIRHLVLPGKVDNSLKVLRFIAENFSPRVHISLMSQYCPTPKVKGLPDLGRGVTSREYRKVIREMSVLGMNHGWTQELDSKNSYQPDFNSVHPFEK